MSIAARLAELAANIGPIAPFVAATGKGAHLNGARIIEAVVIALLSSFATYQVQGVQIEALGKSITALQSEVQQIRGDIYKPRFGP